MIYFFNRNFCSSLTLWPKAPAPFPLVNLCSRCFPSSECLVSSYLVLSIQASPIQLERFPLASLTPPRRTQRPCTVWSPPHSLPGGQLTRWDFASARSAVTLWGVHTEVHPNCPSSAPKETLSAVFHRGHSRARLSRPGWARERCLPQSSEARAAKRPGCLFHSLFTKFQVSSNNRGHRRPVLRSKSGF